MSVRIAKRQNQPRPQIVATVAILLAVPAVSRAASDFNSMLDMELKVVTPVITDKFGFATMFPRPADPAPPAPAGPNPTGDWNWEQANGGTVFNVPDPIVAERKRIPKGNGIKLHVGGHTDALPVNGSFAWGEGWASGRTRIRLGNFTGRPGMPFPETLKIDLELNVLRELLADASNDPLILDWANAKYQYEVINATTGDVLVSRTAGGEDFEGDPAIGLPLGQDVNPIATIKLPAGEFWNIELFGHVYAAGSSEGANPVPPIIPSPGIAKVQDRAQQDLPDPAMQMTPLATALFGDATGHGPWRVGQIAGVTGEDPFAHEGRDTIMVGQAVTGSEAPMDLEIAVEVPFDSYSQLVMEDVLAAAGGYHGFLYDLQLGHGVGDEFQMSQDPQLLSFAGPESPMPPQEHSGGYQLAGANDPFNPTQLTFEGMLNQGQQGQFLLTANVHDSVDGVLDGMARFTIRQFMEGFGGDYNGDFAVDQQDLELLGSLLGTQDLLADGDANGFVDGGDMLLWQRQSGGGEAGATFPPALAAQAVPEPSAAGLLLISVAATIGKRRCRAR